MFERNNKRKAKNKDLILSSSSQHNMNYYCNKLYYQSLLYVFKRLLYALFYFYYKNVH